MRTHRFFGGMIGLLGIAGSAAAQGFAADRGATTPQPTTPTPPVATAPTTPQPAPAAYPTTPAPVRPTVAAAGNDLTGANAQTHPRAVRPEHGPFMICVRSFSGPQARQLAEELSAEIRANHKAAAYLFEWGAADKRKEEARQDAYREALNERNAPFLQLRDEMRKKAAAEGRVFVDTPVTIRVPKVKYSEQWAVLVGGFDSMDKASAALKYLRTLPPATDKPHLLDSATVAKPGANKGDQANVESAYLNTYAQAFAAPNPALTPADAGPSFETDKNGVPLLKIWNQPESFSLLNCPGDVTLVVKSFNVPARTTPTDTEMSVLDRLFNDDSAKVLDATAKQAHQLAESLRSPEMVASLQKMGLPAQPIDAYVLHHKIGSFVTVGSYDGPDDPRLLQMKRVLEAITFEVREQQNGPVIRRDRMFVTVYPIAVPKFD